MNPPVVVLGGGGHARVLIDALRLLRVEIAGVVDPALAGTVLGAPVLGGDEVLDTLDRTGVRLVNGLGSVGLPGRREELFEHLKGKGFSFASVVHPAAVVAADVELGEGVQVMAGALVQTGSSIGANSIINTRASVDHDCRIGRHVHVAPGVTLSGNVTVGEGSHLGTGATAIQGVTIGAGALIAAGAVVVGEVAAGKKVRGVPAREFV